MQGGQNHTSVGNGQSHGNESNVTAPMRIPHFDGKASYTHGNPPISAQTITQNAAKAAKLAMNMPQYKTHQTAMACSMQSAYPHGGIQAATFGYMEPQHAQYRYTPNYNFVQTQQVVPLKKVTNTSATWGKPNVGGFTRSCYNIAPFDGRSWSEYKFHFMILCWSFSLQGFLEVPGPWGYGFAFPVNEPDSFESTCSTPLLCTMAYSLVALKWSNSKWNPLRMVTTQQLRHGNSFTRNMPQNKSSVRMIWSMQNLEQQSRRVCCSKATTQRSTLCCQLSCNNDELQRIPC